jgi:hypothetical protein
MTIMLSETLEKIAKFFDAKYHLSQRLVDGASTTTGRAFHNGEKEAYEEAARFVRSTATAALEAQRIEEQVAKGSGQAPTPSTNHY